MNNQQQIKRLSNAINRMLEFPEVQQVLEAKKQEAIRLRAYNDFIWRALLNSFSTLGDSTGYDRLITNQDNYNRVKYEALKPLIEEERYEVLRQTLCDASIRFYLRKSRWLTNNYNLIKEQGGCEVVKEKLLSQDGRDNKIDFLKQFHGIGNKYSRNIMMDIYHPEFHQSIAIDSRLEDVLKELGLPEKNYEIGEQFFLDIAKECHVDGWTIDRILYNFKGNVLTILKSIE
ncbi:MAG: hypothetical protein SFZ02_13860 [bacterium]|nr:hypothetical protein [bacterium]